MLAVIWPSSSSLSGVSVRSVTHLTSIKCIMTGLLQPQTTTKLTQILEERHFYRCKPTLKRRSHEEKDSRSVQPWSGKLSSRAAASLVTAQIAVCTAAPAHGGALAHPGPIDGQYVKRTAVKQEVPSPVQGTTLQKDINVYVLTWILDNISQVCGILLIFLTAWWPCIAFTCANTTLLY